MSNIQNPLKQVIFQLAMLPVSCTFRPTPRLEEVCPPLVLAKNNNPGDDPAVTFVSLRGHQHPLKGVQDWVFLSKKQTEKNDLIYTKVILCDFCNLQIDGSSFLQKKTLSFCRQRFFVGTFCCSSSPYPIHEKPNSVDMEKPSLTLGAFTATTSLGNSPTTVITKTFHQLG